ncbi:HNH endonuclease signature motif containing protein [Subtercola endophyticus]|uniref:HNH endonuclease signature motif containing protein n=1 Tax=Subtercola endophyticus TaxID=2895559 RepID=UPI001E2C7FC7|nr:HNH endonuclease signature motif containing protein [Subtercola endophyticus]UFS59572.1 HNH endonuclease [Subtercola endophyticus]
MSATPPPPTGSPAGSTDGAADEHVRVSLGVLLAEAVAACGECGVFRAAAPCGLADEELLAGLVAVERLGRLVDGLRTQVAGDVADRSRHELGEESLARKQGFANAVELIVASTSVSRSTARSRIKLGAQVLPSVVVGMLVPSKFPEVEDALRSGLIGVDTADAIVRPLSEAAPNCGTEEIRAVERQLVEWAVDGVGGVSLPADDIRGLAVRARESLDADGAEPRYKDLEAKRGLTFSNTRSGCVRVNGVLTPEQGGVWMAVDHAISSPRVAGHIPFDPGTPHADAGASTLATATATATTATATGADAAADAEAVAVDTRTLPQRRVDVFTEVIRVAAGLPGMPQINGARPVLNIHATLDDVVSGRGVGWIDGINEPVPASVVAQTLCHADIVTTLFGAHGEVLHLGKTRRLFSAAQNRALANRDGGCVWKGCNRPPQFCESHHVVDWKDDTYAPGVTDVCNGALLCKFHHNHLHTADWRLVMVDGVPHLIPPKWVDHEQRPQRCRQTSDRFTNPGPPDVFNRRRRDSTPARPRFTDTD